MPVIRQASNRHQVPIGLVIAVIQQESAWTPDAKSNANAVGAMQFIASTAKGLGVKNRYDYQDNISHGVEYLSMQYQKFGRWDYALAAYNAGPGAVQRFGGMPPYRETQKYVENILVHFAKIKGDIR